ncbi:septal ring lytic transglycosylase RlpA family protein [Microcoleus sp. FACHB-68]|uniref:septal ring lytic transglycosylase RlpA family protein n=1 Tax=Microcoleus sp. FACHB-68 TaxID=2692826 RepID=UPI0018F04E81
MASGHGLAKSPVPLISAVPAKGLSAAGFEINWSHSWFSQAKASTSISSSFAPPVVLLPLNWMLQRGRNSPQLKRVKPFRSWPWLNFADKPLCPSEQVPQTPQLITVSQTTQQPFEPLDVKVPVESDSANKIFEFFHNLVPRTERVEPPSQTVPVSVVVIRTEQNAQAGSTQAKAGDTKLQGFWRNLKSRQDREAAGSSSNLETFQVRVKEYVIAEVPGRAQANKIAQALEQSLKDRHFQPAQLQPTMVNGMPALKAGTRIILTIDKKLSAGLKTNRELLAIEWVNNLRIALETPPLTLVEAQAKMHQLVETPRKIAGLASWYGPYFEGRPTATGETYRQTELTAAHPSLPFDTYLKVTSLESRKTVIVRVNDRGPYVGDRALDLSREAARCLNSVESGVVPVEAVVMQKTRS